MPILEIVFSSSWRWLAVLVWLAACSVLWRIRGGWKKDQIPENKIWFSLAIGLFSWGWGLNPVIAIIMAYTSHQLFGWGKYIGALNGGGLNPDEPECELIDGLLTPCRVSWRSNVWWLKDYPRLYGFLGTSLTGLIMTFQWGLFYSSLWVMLAGLMMGPIYWLGSLIGPRLRIGGWAMGEWLFGPWLGYVALLGVE